jgi:hypothetical protein
MMNVLFRSIHQQLSGGDCSEMLAHDRQRCGFVILPVQRPLRLAAKAVNPDEMISAVMLYMQLGEYSYRLRALQLLCQQTWSEPLFNTLRTEQQLGYSDCIYTGTLRISMNGSSCVCAVAGLGMALNSAVRMRICARVQIPVCPEPPGIFSHELLSGWRTGFLVVSPLRITLHVYSSTWSDAKALSEYVVVPE